MLEHLCKGRSSSQIVFAIPAVGLVLTVGRVLLTRYVLSGIAAETVGTAVFHLHDLDAIRFALPIAFSRFAIPASTLESREQRAFAALLLGVIAYVTLHVKKDDPVAASHLDDAGMQSAGSIGRPVFFSLLLSCQFVSYASWQLPASFTEFGRFAGTVLIFVLAFFVQIRTPQLAFVLCCGVGSYVCAQRLVASINPPAANESLRNALVADFLAWLPAGSMVLGFVLLPFLAPHVADLILPISELKAAYNSVAAFAGQAELASASMEMIIVSANVNVALGYLGIAYLRYAQERSNALLQVGGAVGQLPAREFTRRAARWVFVISLPFILQSTLVTSVHSHAFSRFRHKTERSLRLHGMFPNHGTAITLKAVASSDYTVETYADAINGVVEMSHAIVCDKLSALPKLMLVPGILASKPGLLFAVLPASVALDVGKSYISATLTLRIEAIHRELLEFASKRRQIEVHDTRNEELIQRGHAAAFTQQQWRAMGDKIEDRGMRLASLQRLHGSINSIYHSQLLGPGIECALAFLMEVGYAAAAEIGVYTAVIEQAIDTLLTRHRNQATLANIATKVGVVNKLASRLSELRGRARPACSRVGIPDAPVEIRSLKYSRGQTHVQIRSLTLASGRVYAVTGANGCGKRTALGILASCGNAGSALPAGTELIGPPPSISLPAGDLVEIAQHLYCPLFTTPMSWLLQQDAVRLSYSKKFDAKELLEFERRVVNLFSELSLFTSDDSSPNNGDASSESRRSFNVSALWEEKEDWYSELSGGEKTKVEFIRKVFLRPRCPSILLIDEAFAPLDPAAALVVQRKLKDFCRDSIILVVYHGKLWKKDEQCLQSDGFFDDNLHFANNTASLISTCY